MPLECNSNFVDINIFLSNTSFQPVVNDIYITFFSQSNKTFRLIRSYNTVTSYLKIQSTKYTVQPKVPLHLHVNPMRRCIRGPTEFQMSA